MTFGFSRDDAGGFLQDYYDNKIFESDPFAHLDQRGVGKLVKMATELGRSTRPNIKLGICGEHGGDPASIEFCHRVGLNYVSCSPYRVPIARLAAAQAAVRDKQEFFIDKNPIYSELASTFRLSNGQNANRKRWRDTRVVAYIPIKA